MSAGAEHIPGMLEKAALDRGGQPEEVAEVGGVPRVRPRVVRHRRHHPGRRRVGPRRSPEHPPTGVRPREARAVRVPRSRRPSADAVRAARRARRRRRRCSRAARASSRCWRCASRSSSTSSTSGASPELAGIERRDDALWIGAGTTDAAVERERRGRGRRAAARPGDAAHRPLPDPQPRHARRIDRPRRPGRRVPRRRARARRDHGGRLADAVAARSRRATSSTASGARRMAARRAARRRDVPDLERAVRLRASRSSPAATATSRSPAPTVGVELDADDRIRRCAIGLDRPRIDARTGRRRRGASSPAGRSRTSSRRRSAASRWPGSTSVPVRPARLGRRTARGSARSWWRGRGRAAATEARRWLRSR